MSIVTRTIGAACGIAALTACGASADDPETTQGRTAQVYETAIRSIVDDEVEDTTTTDEDSPRPVVYVVTIDGSRIDDEVQVKLVQELDDDVNLHIQDDRSEAIDDGEEDEPVRDEGILILLGPVLEDENETRFDLRLERYRSLDEHDELLMSFRFDGEDWSVTSTSVMS